MEGQTARALMALLLTGAALGAEMEGLKADGCDVRVKAAMKVLSQELAVV